MKRVCLMLAAVLILLPAIAAASNFYLFPDSNRRRLTYEEVWEWQYDALGYAFNELFARYGRPFEPGGKYDNYFRCQNWYVPRPEGYPRLPDGRLDDGPLLSKIEWDNYVLIKDVRAQMRAMDTDNPAGKPLPPVFDDRISSPLSGFAEKYFQPDQRLKVYDGPGTHYRRGANGKAVASTNGSVYVAGWESGWLMVMYRINSGGVRIGFASPGDFRDRVDAPALNFQRVSTRTLFEAQLTEDPLMTLAPIARLPGGTQLTWLSRFHTQSNTWDYVELTLGGTLTRGFLPYGTVDLGFVSESESE